MMPSASAIPSTVLSPLPGIMGEVGLYSLKAESFGRMNLLPVKAGYPSGHIGLGG